MQVNPKGPDKGDWKIYRGNWVFFHNSWLFSYKNCCPYKRGKVYVDEWLKYIGLRIVYERKGIRSKSDSI